MPEFRGPAAVLRPVRALVALFVLLMPVIFPAPASARVVVLGFDGADARLVERWMNEGKLPNLDRLRREGTWSPLGTTTPPQTPVSWTSFATGINPGRHGIFDFLSRDVATYQPGYAMFDIRDVKVGAGKANGPLAGGLAGLLAAAIAWPLLKRARGRLLIVVLAAAILGGAAGMAVARLVPVHRPVVTRKTVGTPFWEVAANAGKKCRIIRVPAMFPPDPVKGGEIHAGLGVPDIRGTNGNYTYYTTETMSLGGANTEKGGRIENVAFLDGHTTTTLYGPRNRLFDDPPDITLPLELKLRREAGDRGVDITVGGKTMRLPEGAWSDWVELEFAFNPLIRAHGLARFYLQSVE
ncbi:MAG TPA: alkaline phosphatase family protein, partial [Candidatus Eisenbacteria bacterium]